MLPKPGIGSGMVDVDATSVALETVLEQVGPGLRRLRTQRGITLTGLAETTGISKSTLSRLESGQRRPTLELLLALSMAYRVPLDDARCSPTSVATSIRPAWCRS